MASIHTPNSLATSMGLIAGILIGEIAISVGLFTEVIVLLGRFRYWFLHHPKL